MLDKSKFLKNYKGILNPEIAFNQAKAQAEVKAGKFKNATYNSNYNRQLEREHVKNAGKR